MTAAAAAAAVPTTGGSLIRPTSAREAVCDWWFKFWVLLMRQLMVYIRNPVNVLARCLAYAGASLFKGSLLHSIGSVRGLLGLNIMTGTSAFLDSIVRG